MISFHNVLHGQLVNIVSNQAPLNGIDPDVNMLAHENTFIKNNKYVAIKQLDDLNKNSKFNIICKCYCPNFGKYFFFV